MLIQQYQTIFSENNLRLAGVGSHQNGSLSLLNDTVLWPGKNTLYHHNIIRCYSIVVCTVILCILISINMNLLLLNITGGLPYDGTPVYVLVTVSVPVVVVYYVIATIGIVLAFGCYVFNFTFRKTKYVKV